MANPAPDAAWRGRAGSLHAWRELVIVVAVLGGYFGARLLVEGDRGTGVRNAERMLDLEARLGIDVERAVQEWVLDRDVLRAFLSVGYVWFHWPLLIVAMVYLTLRAPAVQARLRNAIFASGVIGVVLFATVPTAPPRFMPGFVGTVSDAARRHYLPYSLEWTNELAALPSYHVGWTTIACLAVVGVVRSWWRWWLLSPAVVVGLAVVATGNHYVLDTVAGLAFALVAWFAVRPRAADPIADGARLRPPTTGASPGGDAPLRRPDG